MNKKINWLLILTVLLAFFLRVWQLGQLPTILNRDEAALAYNAYLLSETGQDEWQRSWPLALESFGDYKLAGYPLLLIPFFKIFGLTDFAVRLPSALAGTILVPLVFLLSRKIKLTKNQAWLASLLVAVSPVFIWYSRLAFEANVALTYLVAALVVLLDFQHKARRWHTPLLITLLLLAIFTYNTPLLLLPVLMIFAWLQFAKKQKNKLILVELIFGGVFFLGISMLFSLAAQKSGITIFSDETIWQEWSSFRAGLNQPWQSLIGNRYFYFIWLSAKNLFNSLSPKFLITTGGNHPWHSLPNLGHILLTTYSLAIIAVTAMIGRTVLAFKKMTATNWSELAWVWLLLASLLPAIITVDAPHATRSLLFFVLLQPTAVWGLAWLTKKLKQTKFVWALIVLLIALEATNHAYQLFMVYPSQTRTFQPGFAEVVRAVEDKHSDQSVAIVDPSGYHYILLAWYLKLPPTSYFETVIRQQPDQIGFRYGEQLTHYHFIAEPQDRSQNETILIQWSEENSVWSVEEDL
ncbi:MAG: glycosyltransferase family 39 protein [Candidatus Paceibacterota bacterium]